MESSKKRKMLEEVFSDVAEPAVESLEGGDVRMTNIKTAKTNFNSQIIDSLKMKQNEIVMQTEELILDNQQKAEQIERIHGLWKSKVHILKEEKKQANVMIKNMFKKVENKDLENAKLDDDIKNKDAMISELQHDLEIMEINLENLYISELESKVSKLEDKCNTLLVVAREKEEIITESSIKFFELKQIISGMKLAEKEQNEAISNLNISLEVKYQEETKFKDKLNDQQKQFTIQYETLNSDNMAKQLEFMNQNTMLEKKLKTCTDKMKEEFETKLNSFIDRNKITMDSLLHEAEAAAEAAAEVASKNENLKNIITEKENQVTNLQTTINSLQIQTEHIHNQIIQFIGDEAIVNANLDWFGVINAKFENLSKVSKDKLEEKDKLLERLQARQDQANQPALFKKLAEKMGESYESV